MKSSLMLFLKGVAIGVANIIPGVSGGTMAVVLGIYERLIESIGSFFKNKDKRLDYIQFVALLGIGAVVGIKGFGEVLNWALDEHRAITFFLFMGLILGSLPPVIRMSGIRKFRALDMGLMALGVIAVLALGDPGKKEAAKARAAEMVDASPVAEGEVSAADAALADADMVTLGVCGFAAGAAMIVPGISGSLVLLLLGQYNVVIAAVHKLDFASLKILVVVGIMACLGVATFAKLIEIALARAHTATYSLIIGLVGGSVVALNPGIPTGVASGLACAAFFIGGTVLSYWAGRNTAAA